MAEELKKLGADVEELKDGLIINRSKLKATKLDGRGDHRIVMSLALAGMAIDPPRQNKGKTGGCTIDTAEAMNVTFPEFAELMTSIGACLELK
jgi:3-phosphoshikimate 1-carboxyvinyltransferase